MFIQYYVNIHVTIIIHLITFIVFSHGLKLFAQIEIMKSSTSGLNERILLLNK